jgi:hypothetical protein
MISTEMSSIWPPFAIDGPPEKKTNRRIEGSQHTAISALGCRDHAKRTSE